MRPTSTALFAEAQKYIPGGVNSPVRAFKGVGGTPVFFERAKGSLLYDADGTEYVDYIGSWGPMILGHCNDEVLAAISAQLGRGMSFGAPTALETQIAKLISEMVPNIDLIRMVNSGTEACMSAIRLARGYTGRNKIIKFEGCYHGHADSFLIKAGSGASTLGIPNSPGVPAAVAADTLIGIYNNIDQVRQLAAANKGQIAAVILEPVAGNMGCVPPSEAFVRGLRQMCTEEGIVLIFDEVMTGFRLAKGGAEELFGIDADLVCFGKVIGGGMPVGAYAGKREIMSSIAPLGPVYQAGTLSGNPIAMASGLATLSILNRQPEIYRQLEDKTQYLSAGLASILNEKGMPHTINQRGSMMSVFFSATPVVDFQTAALANNDYFNRFFHGMLDRGVYLAPSSFETWFLAITHTQALLDRTLDAARSVIKSL